MPRADLSLRELLNRSAALKLGDGLDVLKDVLDALSDLDGRIVHRDIKPENVLASMVDGAWPISELPVKLRSFSARAGTSAATL
jgi:eukaryotic-like serine/threonine-protein kinase